VEADRVIEAIESALKEDAEEYLSKDEQSKIEQAKQNLITARSGTNGDALNTAMKALEKVSEFYVARRMNASVQKAMAGQSVDTF
jgi:molecular chaperone HscA